MSDTRVRCPVCGHPSLMEATAEERAADPPRMCSPLRCSAWKVVGKATAPHPITGARTMLRVVSEASPTHPGHER